MIRRLLILGGTKEARLLAQANQDRPNLHITLSLAGLSCSGLPRLSPFAIRYGRFHTAKDFALWLTEQAIDAVLDASHPFATHISHQAALACTYTNIVRLSLHRPSFPYKHHYHRVVNLSAALADLPLKAHILLTTGSRGLRILDTRPDCYFFIRTLTQPGDRPHKAPYQILQGLPTNDWYQERSLMIAHGITALITKDSGGQDGIAKLTAAHSLDLPIWLITRPPPPPPPLVATLKDAQAWLERLIASL